MTGVFSSQNSVSLCPASFHTPRPNLPVTPGVSWLPTFAFQSPIMKRTSFGVLVLKGLVGLHGTVQLQLLQQYWLGHGLGLPWYWMVCLWNEQRSFSFFWDCIQVLHFGLFCWPWWLLHFFWGNPTLLNPNLTLLNHPGSFNTSNYFLLESSLRFQNTCFSYVTGRAFLISFADCFPLSDF